MGKDPSAELFSQNWRRHRQRVKAAQCSIDARPPIIHQGCYTRVDKLKGDAETKWKHTKDNTALICRIADIMKLGGLVDTFPPHLPRIAFGNNATVRRNLRRIEEENSYFGKRLQSVQPVLDTWNQQERFRREKIKKVEPFTLPANILEKYGLSIERYLALPQDLLRKLLRPRIFFDVENVGQGRLGRVIIELFTEACPQVVLELVRACKSRSSSSFAVRRIFPQLWLSADLRIPKDSICTKRIEYDMRALDHASGTGIVSFARSDLDGFKNGNLPFAISFKPLSVVNGRRVAFGRVITGFRTLSSLTAFGSKTGKLLRNIKVGKCGLKR